MTDKIERVQKQSAKQKEMASAQQERKKGVHSGTKSAKENLESPESSKGYYSVEGDPYTKDSPATKS